MTFYKLQDDERFPDAEWDVARIDMTTVTCPLSRGHQRASGRLNDLTIILPSIKIGDFSWTVFSECIVTDRVAKLFRQEALTGYRLSPVHVSGIRAKGSNVGQVPQLWELQLNGWAGIAGPESGIVLRSACEGCGHLVYSTYTDASQLIDPKNWDGSDFFMVWPLPRYVFVTERVRDVVLGEGLSGSELIPVQELESPRTRNIDSLSPGRLRDWMPEGRARQLGEPLGIY
jgi:hypothetical protein